MGLFLAFFYLKKFGVKFCILYEFIFLEKKEYLVTKIPISRKESPKKEKI